MLFGKILVVNVLVVSLFTYKFAILPLPSDAFFKKFENFVMKFIWKGKSKISKKIICGLKTEGGGGLVDLRSKDAAMKIQWIFKLQSQPLIKEMAYQILGNPIGDLFWKIQLKIKHFKELFPGNSFWFQLAGIWNKYSMCTQGGPLSVFFDNFQ